MGCIEAVAGQSEPVGEVHLIAIAFGLTAGDSIEVRRGEMLSSFSAICGRV